MFDIGRTMTSLCCCRALGRHEIASQRLFLVKSKPGDPCMHSIVLYGSAGIKVDFWSSGEVCVREANHVIKQQGSSDTRMGRACEMRLLATALSRDSEEGKRHRQERLLPKFVDERLCMASAIPGPSLQGFHASCR